MSATNRFIEDAVKGGWEGHVIREMHDWRGEDGVFHSVPLHSVFTNPLAWQAVGKTRGWGGNKECNKCGKNITGWKGKLTGFIDHLADSKTIEEALLAIE